MADERYFYCRTITATEHSHYSLDGTAHGATLHNVQRAIPYSPDAWFDGEGKLVLDPDLVRLLNEVRKAAGGG